ncbi:hypothetical protein ZWY2020_014564 [Hordeum vulgare]|nr:hypothetical protein ZWY2020_014564 [Hordeum vulgare]
MTQVQFVLGARPPGHPPVGLEASAASESLPTVPRPVLQLPSLDLKDRGPWPHPGGCHACRWRTASPAVSPGMAGAPSVIAQLMELHALPHGPRTGSTSRDSSSARTWSKSAHLEPPRRRVLGAGARRRSGHESKRTSRGSHSAAG